MWKKKKKVSHLREKKEAGILSIEKNLFFLFLQEKCIASNNEAMRCMKDQNNFSLYQNNMYMRRGRRNRTSSFAVSKSNRRGVRFLDHYKRRKYEGSWHFSSNNIAALNT